MNDDDKFKLTLIALIVALFAYLAYLHSKQNTPIASQLASMNSRINMIQSMYQQPHQISSSSINSLNPINMKDMSPRERKATHLNIQRTMQDLGCR